ncbi:MAG TPA: sigma-70 family RNA polymerase sigma factor [Terriglobales bacterium]|nr:sigma-70 family RNA polymerase sigma factor [Terriglobales bacterium]
MEDPGEVTSLLRELAHGNRGAETKLMPLVYGELRHLAAAYMRRERTDHTLQATALVHEAYLKLLRGQQPNWQNRTHFYAIAARAMRLVLTDHARNRMRVKRGGHHRRSSLDQVSLSCEPVSVNVMALNHALDRLASVDPRQSRIVELKFFAGLSVEEIAEIMTISPRTVRRDWNVARAWLFGDLTNYHEDAARQMGEGQVIV